MQLILRHFMPAQLAILGIKSHLISALLLASWEGYAFVANRDTGRDNGAQSHFDVYKIGTASAYHHTDVTAKHLRQ